MNTSTLTSLALVMGAIAPSLAANATTATPVATAPAEAPAFTLCDYLPNALRIFDAERENAENPWIQSVNVKLRAQYQMSAIDPAGGGDRVMGGKDGNGRRTNAEWRRVRLGVQAKVLNHFTLYSNWNVGGVDTRQQYKDGSWDSGESEGVIDELYVQGTFKPVTFTLGKHKPAFIGEYRTSSSKIITLERSALVNQLTPDKLYGISFKNADKKAKLGWEFGAWANGLHEGVWAEPAFNSGDNLMVGGSLSYATSDKSRLYLDYMHSFVNTDRPQADSEYAGPGARDILALTWEAKQDKLSFMAEAIAGFNVMDGTKNEAENVYGLVLMPSYRFTPHVEGVFRYQLASGSNAVKHDSRYATTNGDFSKTCDLMHGLYFGVNYYVCPKNPDTMRLMAGAEYLNSHGEGAKGDKGFTGWTYSAGVRCNF